ncbi:P-loop NTPase family protein, partial [Staphylococcus epidermidis]
GGNGGGKTRIIGLIMDLIECESGRMCVFEKDIKIDGGEIKNKIGFVYCEIYFNEKWRVKKLENMIAAFYDGW